MPITKKDRVRVLRHTMTFYDASTDSVLCTKLGEDLEILTLAIEALEARTRD